MKSIRMNQFKNILFDLDGTIIEPQEGIINSVLFALKKMKVNEKNHEALKSFIGPPLIDSFANRYNLNRKEAAQAVDYYREYFSKKGIYESTLYDNISMLLEVLKNDGLRLFLATSKPTFYAEQILSNYKLCSFFEGVVGSNLDNTRKDKTEIIEFVITEFGLKNEETLMIGDRNFDIIGARNNSIKSIGVSYGHGSHKELSEAKADFIANSCVEVLHLIKSSIAHNMK